MLLFLIVGMLFGSDGLGIVFNDVNKANFIGMVALCIILFTGGMETKLSEISLCLDRDWCYRPSVCFLRRRLQEDSSF